MRLFYRRGLDQLDLIEVVFTVICLIYQYPDTSRSNLTLGLDWLFESRYKSRPGEPTTARTNIYTCLCMQANRLKHVCTFLIRYGSCGTPYILRNLRRVPDCGPLSEEVVPASAPATSRLFVLPVPTRRCVLTDNTIGIRAPHGPPW